MRLNSWPHVEFFINDLRCATARWTCRPKSRASATQPRSLPAWALQYLSSFYKLCFTKAHPCVAEHSPTF